MHTTLRTLWSFSLLLGRLVAQEADGLAPLRAAFAAGSDRVPRVAVAIVGDAVPTILCGGRIGEVPVDAATLLPIGGAARLLIADALLVDPKTGLGEIECTIRGRELTRMQLLGGSEWLPDWFALGAVDAPPDRAALLACSVVARPGCTFAFLRCSVGEITVIEPTLFGDGVVDWPGFVRTRLSPHGAAVDVVDAVDLQGLGAEQRANSAAPAGLATSPAPSLRLLLSVRDVATWWRWRLQQRAPLLQGLRAGYTDTDPNHADEPRWTWEALHGPFAWHITAFPQHHAVLVEFDAGAAQQSLAATFANCVLGPPRAASQRFGGRLARIAPDLDAVHGSWVAKGAPSLRLEIAELPGVRVKLTCGDESFVQTRVRCEDGVVTAELSGAEDRTGELLLAPVGTGADAELMAVFVRRDATSAVPRRVDFVRAPRAAEHRDR